MTRRQFLQAGGLAALGGILAACGGSVPLASAPASKLAASAAPAASGAKLLPLIAGQGATVAVSSPMWMADYLKLYQKHGVDFTLKEVATTAITPAMLNKEVDMSISSSAPMVTANLMGGIPQVYIAGYVTMQTVSLHVAPSITSGEDLRGKLVGSDKPGTPTDFNTRQALAEVGLKASDVELAPLGGGAPTLAALVAGKVVAIATPPPFSFRAEAAGFRMLANTYRKPNLTNGAIVLKSRIEELAPALQPFVEALREGAIAFEEQPDAAIKMLVQYTKEDDLQIAKQTYEFFTTKVKFDRSLRPSAVGLTEVLKFLGETTVPPAKDANPEQFIDTRFVDRLPK
jgi:ABC-type nitrate/sulfonate/bicarbonate transport system substrate-binding protein